MATFILPIAQALRLRGIDAMEVIESAGIDPAGVINPDRRISFDTFQSLLRRSVELTGDEAFGLLAAEQLQPQVLHGLGLAWLAAAKILKKNSARNLLGYQYSMFVWDQSLGRKQLDIRWIQNM